MLKNLGILGAAAILMVACSEKKGGPGTPRTPSGKATVNVTGKLNKSANFGGNEPNTKVGCYHGDANMRHSYIRMSEAGKSKFRVDVKEGLTLDFQTADIPLGRVNFTMNNVSYVTTDDLFQSSGRDCYVDLAQSGGKLTGTVNCANMQSNDGNATININATFECNPVHW